MYFSFLFFFWLHLCWSLADVSCHVLAALPVPLGQCDCHSAVSGDFLRHHPTAPWDAAWTDHHPHDRWADYSDKPKQMFSPSDIRVMWPWQQHRGFWLLLGLIRLSQALEKITSLFFRSRFIFPSWLIIIASIDTWGSNSYQLFSKCVAQWLFFH